MIHTVAMLGCLLAAVEITVSPDQPLGYSYIDDPLILEIRSDERTVEDIHVTLTAPSNGREVRKTFPETALGPSINRWCAMKSLPPLRGPWRVSVSVGAAESEPAHEATVYRIDRPGRATPLPLFAYGSDLNRDALLALRGVSVLQVRVSASHPDLDALLIEMQSLGMTAIVAFDSAVRAEETAASLAERHCGTIAHWELDSGNDTPEALMAALATLQALPCSIPAVIGIRDAGPILALRQTGTAPGIEHIVVYGGEDGPAALRAIRQELAHPGDESPRLEYVCTPAEANTFLNTYLDALACGASGVGFPAALVVSDRGLEPGLATLNGLVHGVPLVRFAGRYPAPKGAQALLFSLGDAWTMAYWAEDEGAAIEFPWEEGASVHLFDQWNNPLDIVPPEENSWRQAANPEPRILRGNGGPLPKATLVAEVSAKAKQLLAQEDLDDVWSEGARATLQALRETPISDQSRVHFFALLRAFPDIEEHWHAGEIARPDAVAALAGLADLARTLCRLEAARGASFLEPLQDTLARCEEYQSRYLTGSTSTPQARIRGDWIVQEVRRLMDEVETLLNAGAKIEADAVAALAEWRARGLEFAAKAGPQSDQMTLANTEPEAETKGKK